MRRAPTEPEKRLWRHLSNSQLGGFKFRRQAAIPPFIVDFFCPAKGLIVEVDGETHVSEADARRDELLASRGFPTIRFTNDEVMSNMDGVLTSIFQTLQGLPYRQWGAQDSPTPNPSPEGEGL
ncbi:MAG TPA: endonuclease domain-containing protein [Allosphingosinicella sp.]|nr:endonuclease domain-containing protein [Allosphingosinicella sp.]